MFGKESYRQWSLSLRRSGGPLLCIWEKRHWEPWVRFLPAPVYRVWRRGRCHSFRWRRWLEPSGSRHLDYCRASDDPLEIDSVRITGFKFAVIDGVFDPLGGGVTYPAQELPLSPTYTLEGVPSNTTDIRIEYLDAGQTVGLYVEEITLVPGQVFEIVDPAFVSRPEGVEDFEIFIIEAEL